jgi:hypothetical protein
MIRRRKLGVALGSGSARGWAHIGVLRALTEERHLGSDPDYQAYRSRGVLFREEPREEKYGIVAVFEDLYGNRWDLMELKR